jgi:hypothetical protein
VQDVGPAEGVEAGVEDGFEHCRFGGLVVWWFGGSLARVIVFFLLVGTFAETLGRGLVLAGLFTLLRRGWWVEALSNVGGERGRMLVHQLGVQHSFILRVRRGSRSGERARMRRYITTCPLNKQYKSNETTNEEITTTIT